MDPLVVKINGEEYELSTKLKVAYKLQGQHSNKPYTQIFASIGDMRLEDQIGIIYTSFKEANPSNDMKKADFIEAFLDAYGLMSMMELLNRVVEGITFSGMTEEEIEEVKKKKLQGQGLDLGLYTEETT